MSDAYVEANLLSIFYHEFGHAMIDLMGMPVLGQEEDAADTISALLIDLFNDTDSAEEIVRDAAFGFLDEANEAANSNDDAQHPWWDTLGPDLQRYYNLVCQFYGGDTLNRQDLADELELPADRADGCEEEFFLASDSLEPYLDALFDAGPGDTMTYKGGENTITEKLITAEVLAFNAALSLPFPLTISVESCDEANAFYDSEATSIIICTELEAHLRSIGAQ